MTEHTNKQYDAELEEVRSRFLQMGGLVESQITGAIDGLANGDLVALDAVVQRDAEVNRFEVELDEACSHILARRQPTAGDLRMMITVIKMITDMERAGDEAEKIARMAKLIHEAGRMNMPAVELWHMANSVVTMLRKALDAFARLDAQAAAQVVRQDKVVDAEWQGVIRQLVTYMIEDPRTISRSIELLFIAKALERIGDHAKNMCELVVYMVKGRDVRHTGVDNVEREAAAN
ncbi:phosphate signaling complex protein PhoU [Pigmentiphaga litoralis]|uniref:Phosphate-specific transport system accessory protein PhoU n=1 Tax=Pigmentiphaga litoralis TaxID=516702 RepID=A0A7Y9LPX1_9BURK|nr:phosphate signaling complex protein PhoU [Pigmentiphaga litoralis]NYE21649.1 phosphate transport system protein [Pigmentiphaga litoralis]NYE84736.1 phosphate transport system protein [Pigmentiphaga litoralis]